MIGFIIGFVLGGWFGLTIGAFLIIAGKDDDNG